MLNHHDYARKWIAPFSGDRAGSKLGNKNSQTNGDVVWAIPNAQQTKVSPDEVTTSWATEVGIIISGQPPPHI